ncbi:MAG: hypothetical protein VCA55_16625 [Verrucomicrobiales bacterium]
MIQVIRWSGESGAELAQQEFLGYFTERRWKKCHSMVAGSYSDRWNLEREKLSLVMQDFSRQFIIAPRAKWQTISMTKKNTSFEINGIMSFEGGSGHASGFILREIGNYTSEPFSFRWKHSGIMPWSWHLESIDHPTLELPSGYVPGRSRLATVPF